MFTIGSGVLFYLTNVFFLSVSLFVYNFEHIKDKKPSLLRGSTKTRLVSTTHDLGFDTMSHIFNQDDQIKHNLSFILFIFIYLPKFCTQIVLITVHFVEVTVKCNFCIVFGAT